MDDSAPRTSLTWPVRALLVVFVLAWVLGPDELRDAIPIWVVFAIALGLELHFLYGAFRPGRGRAPDRTPQPTDREQLGYAEDAELVLVREGEDEYWIPYSGEEDEEELVPLEHEPFVPAPRSRWAPLRGFLTGVGVIAVLGLAVWAYERGTGWSGVDGEARAAAVVRFSEEASRIAEKPVSIRCDESRDYVGFVQHADGVAIVGGDRAYLTPEICHDLYRLAFESEVSGAKTGRALAVLAHESWHLRGVGNEGTTECYALQSGVELGVRLGLSEDRARQLMRQQLTENQLRGGASVEYRVPVDCVDDSPLDLRPGDSFP